jgi:cytochrome d ubiquinol oxidase subunit II
LAAVLAVVVLAAIIVVPGFILLFVLHEKSLLPEEGVEETAEHSRRGADLSGSS